MYEQGVDGRDERGHDGRVVAMKAGVASPNGVVIQDVPEPKPKAADILVKVKAIALNRADLGSARGDTSHGASAGRPIGSEFSGEVIEAGSDVREFKRGDRVMCHSPGSHAEFAVSDYGRAVKIPDGMGYEQAATLPIGLNTLHNALVTAGRLKAGESVIVQGASSGVGIIGLQIAKLMGATLVVGSSTNAARRARLKEFGADLTIDTNDPGWPDQVLKATDGKGVNLTVDMLSGPTVSQTMQCTALLGRIVNIGRLAGMKAEFDFDLHARKRIDYIGVTFRTRTIEEVRDILQKMRADLWDDVKASRIQVPIDKTYPLADAKAAHEHMRGNKHFGKILLIP
jgi:NADPH2:quinone reductase